MSRKEVLLEVTNTCIKYLNGCPGADISTHYGVIAELIWIKKYDQCSAANTMLTCRSGPHVSKITDQYQVNIPRR